METGTFGSVARNSDHYTTEAVTNNLTGYKTKLGQEIEVSSY
jgi:hypothetical protein